MFRPARACCKIEFVLLTRLDRGGKLLRPLTWLGLETSSNTGAELMEPLLPPLLLLFLMLPAAAVALILLKEGVGGDGGALATWEDGTGGA